MKMISRLAILLVLIPTATLPAWQQDSQSHRKATFEPGWSELLRSMDKMHAAMASVEDSGNVDVNFVRLMVPHHQAAIDMAKAQLLYGKDPQYAGWRKRSSLISNPKSN